MKTMTIEWRHFEQEGDTCVRCSETGAALKQAVAALAEECRPQGWDIRFTETKLGAERIAESNLILLNGKPIEHVLPNAARRETQCQSCGDLLGRSSTCCRAIELDGILYEGIPQHVIRQAVCAVAQCC